MQSDPFEIALSSGPTEPHSFAPPPRPTKQKSPKRWLLPLLGIIVIAGLAGGGYVYWQHGQNKPAAKTSPVAANQTKSQTETTTSQKVPTKSYSSTSFNLGLNYPQAWTLADGTTLTVTSPMTRITDASGAKVSGKVIMTIQPKGQVPSLFGTVATAVLTSQKVDYTQPTANQRGSTYLTFVQYSSTKTTGSLDGIYITGNYGYQKAQNIPSTDIANIDPLVTVSFQKCADAACNANLAPLSIKASDWSDTSFQAPIKTMLTSLAFN